jgi:hypothetical protein
MKYTFFNVLPPRVILHIATCKKWTVLQINNTFAPELDTETFVRRFGNM